MSQTKNKTSIDPYIFFAGQCEKAIEFYRGALGAEVEAVMYFKDSPDPVPEGMLQPGFENKVMHASLKIGGASIMASDGCNDQSTFSGFSLAMSTATEAEAREVFKALSDGGEVAMPIGKTFWSSCYGMVTDKFGVSWMVMVKPECND